MPLKTKLRWAECPEEPPRWTQEKIMPMHHSGKKKKKGGKKKRGY